MQTLWKISDLRYTLAATTVRLAILSSNSRIAVSDADYTIAQGYFNAYGNVNAKDSVDYVVHLGDYIYEYKPDSAIGRNPLPDNELYSLYVLPINIFYVNKVALLTCLN